MIGWVVMTERLVYLDHAATTPLLPEAREAMLPFLGERFGNPNSVHPSGLEAREALEAARKSVAKLINAETSEIVFTSGATEANNLAIRGALEAALRHGERPQAVTTNIEHPSVSETFRDMSGRGVEMTAVAAGRDGVVNAESVLAAVRPDTALVSVMWVNNELGTVQPISEISAALLVRTKRAVLHVDAVQAAPSLDMDVKKTRIDLLSLSAHKFGGPKGVGALYVRRGLKLAPLATGGGQESGIRSGTENVAGIVGMGAAAEILLASKARDRANFKRLQAALDRELAARAGLARRLLEATVPTALHIAALEVTGADADFLVLLLGKRGIAVSAGSACHAGSREASRVLKSAGLADARARSVIRVSFGPSNAEEEAAAFAAALAETKSKARL